MAWKWDEGNLEETPDAEMIAAALVELTENIEDDQEAFVQMMEVVGLAMAWRKDGRDE